MDPHPTPNTNILTASLVGGALSIILVWLLNTAVAGIEIDAVVASAFGTIFTAIVGLFIRPSGGSA